MFSYAVREESSDASSNIQSCGVLSKSSMEMKQTIIIIISVSLMVAHTLISGAVAFCLIKRRHQLKKGWYCNILNI